MRTPTHRRRPGRDMVGPAIRHATDGRLTPLTARLAAECAAAVDPLELAATLEADGLNDESAVGYGCPDVFELAERLYAATPRRPPRPARVPDRWQTSLPRHLLRGVAYALPGLCYAAAGPALVRPAAAALLLLALLAAWGASQALSYLGYIRLGRGDRPAAARFLRRGGACCAAGTAAVTAAAAAALHAGDTVAGLACGQGVYLLAATVALVPVSSVQPPASRWHTDGEWWLLGALAPGTIGAAADLLAGSGRQVPAYLWICCAATVAAIAALAVARTAKLGRPAAGAPQVRAGDGLSLRELADALPYAALGVLAGLLLTFTAIAGLAGRAPAGMVTPASMAATVAPLSLSMGPAEWLLFAYRRHAFRLLHRCQSMSAFAARARWALGASVAGYLAVLTTLSAVFGWLTDPGAGPAVAATVPASHRAVPANTLPHPRGDGLLLVTAGSWRPAGLPPRDARRPAGAARRLARAGRRGAHRARHPGHRGHRPAAPAARAGQHVHAHRGRPRTRRSLPVLRGTTGPALVTVPVPVPVPRRVRTMRRAAAPPPAGASRQPVRTRNPPGWNRYEPAIHPVIPAAGRAAGPLLTMIRRPMAATAAPRAGAAQARGTAGLTLRGAYLALGAALYLALVLQSCGVSAAALWLAGAALAAETALTWAGPAGRAAAVLPAIQLGCYGSLLAGVLGYALVALGKATRHS